MYEAPMYEAPMYEANDKSVIAKEFSFIVDPGATVVQATVAQADACQGVKGAAFLDQFAIACTGTSRDLPYTHRIT